MTIPQHPPELREAVAREIDPWALETMMSLLSPNHTVCKYDEATAMNRAGLAYAKADAILALLPANR